MGDVLAEASAASKLARTGPIPWPLQRRDGVSSDAYAAAQGPDPDN